MRSMNSHGSRVGDVVRSGRVAASPRRSSPSRRAKGRSFARRRRGAAALEFALVAIPLFLFVFSSIEMGRALMALQSMQEAARGACRTAVVSGATAESVEAEVRQTMQMAGIQRYSVAIEPADFAALDRWEPISVTVTATLADVSWLPAPIYVGDLSFSSSCTLPKEYSSED
jgi:Flp pilus assembly protein TadG